MIYRIRLCRDGLWYIQQKRAPGLAGGIWKRVGAGFMRRHLVNIPLDV